jgi:hypothetical protein
VGEPVERLNVRNGIFQTPETCPVACGQFPFQMRHCGPKQKTPIVPQDALRSIGIGDQRRAGASKHWLDKMWLAWLGKQGFSELGDRWGGMQRHMTGLGGANPVGLVGVFRLLELAAAMP